MFALTLPSNYPPGGSSVAVCSCAPSLVYQTLVLSDTGVSDTIWLPGQRLHKPSQTLSSIELGATASHRQRLNKLCQNLSSVELGVELGVTVYISYLITTKSNKCQSSTSFSCIWDYALGINFPIHTRNT